MTARRTPNKHPERSFSLAAGKRMVDCRQSSGFWQAWHKSGNRQARGGDAPRTHSWREWTFAVLEEGQIDSLPGRAIEIFLIALILANVAAVALETVAAIAVRFDALFDAFEKSSIPVYTVEYLLRVWASVEDPPDRGARSRSAAASPSFFAR